MDILFLLIPLSVILVMIIVAMLAWAVHTEQFDDLEHQGELIFEEEELAERADKLRAEAARKQAEQQESLSLGDADPPPAVAVTRVDLRQRKVNDSTA